MENCFHPEHLSFITFVLIFESLRNHKSEWGRSRAWSKIHAHSVLGFILEKKAKIGLKTFLKEASNNRGFLFFQVFDILCLCTFQEL